MNNLVIQTNQNLPAVNLDPSILAKVQQQFTQAAANVTSSRPRLSFAGRAFNLTFGGEKVELQERVLDVHIVAIDPQFHYTFYEKDFNDPDNENGRILSRYPTPEDTFEFTPTAEWKQRTYKQRAVVMLANDPEQKLYIADFGYNSIKKSGNPAIGLFNLSQLITQLDYITRNSNGILPFMLTVQLSFTRDTVPVVQFSLYDQRVQGDNNARFATAANIEFMAKAIASGEVDKLMDVSYDSQEQTGATTKATVQPTAQAVAPQQQVATPAVQQPIVQPQVVTPAVHPHGAQPQFVPPEPQPPLVQTGGLASL